MKRKIGLKELHYMASQMKYYDFENWVAKELFNQPATVYTNELTDKLFLHIDKERELSKCSWTLVKDEELYETECGEEFCIQDGTLAENSYNYCQSCGRKVNSEDKN